MTGPAGSRWWPVSFTPASARGECVGEARCGALSAVPLLSCCCGGPCRRQRRAGRRRPVPAAPDGDGFLRLDTVTGAVSFCRLVGGRWTCETADAANLAAAIAAIGERLGAIEAELGDLRAATAAPLPAADPVLGEAIAALAARVDAALATPPGPAAADLMAEIVAMAARLDELAAAVAAPAPVDLQPLVETIAGLEARLDALLGALAPDTAAIAALLQPLQAEMAALADRIEALAALPVPAPAPVLTDAALAPLRAEIGASRRRGGELSRPGRAGNERGSCGAARRSGRPPRRSS